MNLDYPRDVHDPFAEADPVKLADYRAWAHRALDALLDARLAWETERRAHATQSPLPNEATSPDEGARDLHFAAIGFATKLIGRQATELNAELFDEGDIPGMRAALRRIILKVQMAWPTRPVLVSGLAVRRAILPIDLENALKALDVGHTPDLFVKSEGRETDLLKERCRFAGALWSLHLESRGVSDYTSQVVAAFGLGGDGAKTVQRWKSALRDPATYAQKLGHDHASHVSHLIARATLVHSPEAITGFPPYLVHNVFGQFSPLLLTLEGVGAVYKNLLAKTG